jgi:hypothetical protein
MDNPPIAPPIGPDGTGKDGHLSCRSAHQGISLVGRSSQSAWYAPAIGNVIDCGIDIAAWCGGDARTLRAPPAGHANERSDLNAARISAEKSTGSSHAAK